MRRLAQFVRLRLRLASACVLCVSRLASVCLRLSRVCVRLVRLASRVCVRLSRVKGSECVRLRLVRLRASCASACVLCVLSRVGRLVSRLSRVGRLVSRLSRVCVRRASVVLSRVCLSPCECLRRLAHFMSVVIQRV